MKKIGKRVFAAVLAAALLFAMPGMTVYAEGEAGQEEFVLESAAAQAEDAAPAPLADAGGLPAISNLVVLGEQVKTDEVTSGEGWSYDPETNTLTLENLTVLPENYPADIENFLNRAGNMGNVQLTIHLKGNNTIYGMGINTQVFKLTNTTVYLTGDDGAALTIEGGWIQNHFEISGKIEFIVNENRPFQVDNGIIIDDGAKVTVNYEPDCDSSGPAGMFLPTPGGISIKNGSTLEVNTRSTDYSIEHNIGVYNIYGTGPLIVENSTLILRNDHPNGQAMWARSFYGQYANDYVKITNATVHLNSKIGIRVLRNNITIADSTVNATENTVYALVSDYGKVSIDENSEVNGTAVSYISDAGTPAQYIAYGETNLPAGITVAAGNTLTVPEGASLNIPDGVTLTNNGTMHIHAKASLTGEGTVAGDGDFWIDTVTADLISGTEGLVYNGQDQTEKVKLLNKVTVCGKEFTVDTTAITGWTMSIFPTEVKAAGEYTATLEKTGSTPLIKTFTVAECPHTGLTNQPLGNGMHGGICPDCNEEVSEEHTWEDGVCPVCSGKAAVKVEAGGAITYYDTIGNAAWDAARGKGSAKVTLLADVTLGGLLSVDAGDDITFDGGEFTLTGQPGSTVFRINKGKLTIAGGTVKTETTPSYGGATIMASGGELVVTGGTLEAGTNGIGLSVGQNAAVRLSGGTFSGGKSAIEASGGSVSGLLPNYGSTNAADTHYAFYQDGAPVDLTALADPSKLPGTVTVQECTHAGASGSSNGDGTHDMGACPACGYAGTADCRYSFNGNAGACPVCGDALTVAVSGTSALIYNGAAQEPAVTVTRDGVVLDASGYTVAYENNINAGDGVASVTVTIGNDQGTYTEAFSIQKATPFLTELPTAAEITEGQALNGSALSGGAAVYGDGAGKPGSTEAVAGAFTWKEPSTKPTAADSGVTEYTVVFTPSDTANYNSIEAKIKLTVRAAESEAPDENGGETGEDPQPPQPEAPDENGGETGEDPKPAQPETPDENGGENGEDPQPAQPEAPDENGGENGETPQPPQPETPANNNTGTKQNPQTGRPGTPAPNDAGKVRSPQPTQQGRAWPLAAAGILAAAATGTGVFFAVKKKKKDA